MELEALRSIYFEEFEEVSASPPYAFLLTLTSDPATEVNREQREPYSVTLSVSFPETYPNVAPNVALESDTVDAERIEALTTKLDELAQENLGGAMVYTLASHVKEWLDEIFVGDIRKAVEDEIDRARLAEEEESKKVVTGTPVSAEVFFAWKKKFDAEVNARRAKERGIKLEEKKRKLTGRQLFETDATLVTSDQIEEGDEVVEVDASLFADLHDLDLEDDDQEDRSFLFTDDD